MRSTNGTARVGALVWEKSAEGFNCDARELDRGLKPRVGANFKPRVGANLFAHG